MAVNFITSAAENFSKPAISSPLHQWYISLYSNLFQVWFKNRRAKARQQKKSQQNSSGASSGSSSTEGTTSTTDGDVNVRLISNQSSRSLRSNWLSIYSLQIKSEEPSETTLSEHSQSPCPEDKTVSSSSYLTTAASPNSYAAASFRPQAQYSYGRYWSTVWSLIISWSYGKNALTRYSLDWLE